MYSRAGAEYCKLDMPERVCNLLPGNTDLLHRLISRDPRDPNGARPLLYAGPIIRGRVKLR